MKPVRKKLGELIRELRLEGLSLEDGHKDDEIRVW